MSKFINTSKKMTIDSLIEGFKAKFNNPYSFYTDKKATPSTYYNQNIHKSTLDIGTKNVYSNLGSDAPIRFNRINDLFIFGLDKITTEYDLGEYGLEAADITGQAIILPNTIVPIVNDYFTIDYLEKKLLFKVTSVTMDTIENGANFFKIDYKLDQLDDVQINAQVVETFTMIVDNVGTNYNTIIKSNDYNFTVQVEEIVTRLKKYYKNLFFNGRVQTFIFSLNDKRFYDPYMIEFIIRNDILQGDDEYLFVTHQTSIVNTFALNYDRTFFRFIELKDLNRRTPLINSQAKHINEPLSILSSRIEDYFKIHYVDLNSAIDLGNYVINNFNIDILNKIHDNTYYEADQDKYKNIIIKYFNNTDISADDIDSLEHIDFNESIDLFYNIPIIIYIIEYMIKNILKK